MNYRLLLSLFIVVSMNAMEQKPSEQQRASREKAIIEAIAVTQLNQDESNLRLKAVEAVALDEFATTDLAINRLNAQFEHQRKQILALNIYILKKWGLTAPILEHQIKLEQKRREEQIKTLNNQHRNLRWDVIILGTVGCCAGLYLFYQIGALSAENQNLKTGLNEIKKQNQGLEPRIAQLEKNPVIRVDHDRHIFIDEKRVVDAWIKKD